MKLLAGTKQSMIQNILCTSIQGLTTHLTAGQSFSKWRDTRLSSLRLRLDSTHILDMSMNDLSICCPIIFFLLNSSFQKIIKNPSLNYETIGWIRFDFKLLFWFWKQIFKNYAFLESRVWIRMIIYKNSSIFILWR